jgi:uroporphyrinogen decarboxylase
MNGYERVMAVINGEKPDRIPNTNILMQFAAREIGVKYGEYSLNYRKLVQGNIACAEKYGIDCVTVMQGPMSEASDLGAEVIFPEDGVSYSPAPLIADEKDFLKLKVVEPFEGGRMANIISAVYEYKEQVKGEFAIIGWVEGCFAQAADLMGVTEFLVRLADPDERPFITDVLDFILQQELVYAQAQETAGADIIGVGDAIASVAGPKMYGELAVDYERRLLSAIRGMGAKTKLHICGNIHPFLDQIPAECCDIVDVDWMVPIQDAAAAFNGKCVIAGNYDPVSVLLQGTPDDVDRAVRECAGICGLRHFSAAGCEVPRMTPPENLIQVKKTIDSITE